MAQSQQEFINELVDLGATDDEIVQAVKIKFKPASVAPAPVPSTQDQGRGLFNLPPQAEKAIFPSATSVAGTGAVNAPGRTIGSQAKQAFKGALDVIGTPGRAIASIPAIGNEGFVEALGRKEAIPTTGQPGKFVSNMLRDPITALSTIGTAGAAPAAGGIWNLVKSAATQGARSTIMPAVTRQVEKSVDTGKIDVPKQALEAGLETATGAAGQLLGAGAGKAATKGLQSLAKMSLKQNIPAAAARQTGETLEQGQEKLLKSIMDYDLTRTLKKEVEYPTKWDPTTKVLDTDTKIEPKTFNLGWKAIFKNSQKAIDSRREIVNEYAQKADAAGGTIDVDNIIAGLENKILNSELSYAGTEKSAAVWLKKIKATLDNKGLSGVVPPSKAVELKQFLASDEGLQAFKGGVFKTPKAAMKSRVASDLYTDIKTELENEISSVEPAAFRFKEFNQDIYNLLNVKKAAEDVLASKPTQTQIASTLGLASIAGLLGHGSGVGPIVPALATSAASALTPKGTIPQMLIKSTKLPIPSDQLSRLSFADIMAQIQQNGGQNGVPNSQ